MSDSGIRVEEVTSVEAPPKARVETAPESIGETFARKKDYLEGFLAAKPAPIAGGEVGGDLYEAVIAALKSAALTSIPWATRRGCRSRTARWRGSVPS